MKTALTFILLIAAATQICCNPSVRQVTAAEAIKNNVANPLDCMVYQGSDEKFHYLDRVKFKTTYRFKVLREELELPATIKFGDIPRGMKALPTTQRT